MTSVEIFQSLETLRNTLIQVHVQLTNAFAQLEVLQEQVRKDIGLENRPA